MYCGVQKSWKDWLRTGLNHNQSQDCKRPSKDHTEPVHIGSVWSFAVFQIWKTGLSLGPHLSGSKDQTGPDFQTLTATTVSTQEYYQSLVEGSNSQDINEWKIKIDHAEHTCLEDISVMDILGMRKPLNEETVVPEGTPPKGTVAEWLHMTLEIEEKQYVTQISH